MPGDDVKDHAINSSHDFYALLEIPSSAQDGEIRRAYRKTALKYHPDKVGASDVVARERFDLLQIAYEILSDPDVRQLYDNARRAREEKQEREAAYDGRRRQLKDELERRERAGVAGIKRQREETTLEEEAFQRELKRLAADGARRRKEREEQLRKDAMGVNESGERQGNGHEQHRSDKMAAENGKGVEDFDRSVKVRFPTVSGIDRDRLIQTFSRFGRISDVVLRTRKIKVSGAKHREEYTTAIIVFQSIVSAHAAVTEFPDTKSDDMTGLWPMFEEVNWLGGKQPTCIPAPTRMPLTSSGRDHTHTASTEELRTLNLTTGDASPRKAPSFGSFKGATQPAAGMPEGTPSMEELTRIRLKNAERKRLAEKLRKEEDAEEGIETRA